MGCSTSSPGNPITPIYSNAKYVLNPNCADPNVSPIYVPESTSDGRTTEIIAGTDIFVEDFSDAAVDRFRVNYNPYIPLENTLTVQAYVASVLQSQPILKGKVVDELRSTWTYNKVIASQTLTENGSATSLPIEDRDKTTTGLSITADAVIQLDADDGQGRTGSTILDTETITFGNYQIWGDYTNMIGQPATSVSTLIADMANKNTQIKTTRFNNVFGTGLTGRRFFVIYPASWGEATFTKGIFEGGFQRLKNEAGTLVVTVTGTELPITWTNEEGHAEDMYVYQSLYDNTEDLVEPIVIT